METLRRTTNKPKREAYFVCVADDSGRPEFFDATAHIGQAMPFTRPKATCALRITDDAILFSFLQLSQRSAKTIAASPVIMPRGPLAKLERLTRAYTELDVETVVAVVSTPAPDDRSDDGSGDGAVASGDGMAELAALFGAPVPNGVAADDEPAGADGRKRRREHPSVDTRYEFRIVRDEDGVARLDSDEDTEIELPRGALRMTVFLRSPVPRVDRVIAVGFIGFPGRPGNSDTVRRLCSMVLFSLAQLREFRMLAGVETIDVPPAPNRWSARARPRGADERVVFPVPVYLFSPQLQPVGSGAVTVEIDLDTSPESRFIYKLTPADEIAEAFGNYRQTFLLTLDDHLRTALGAEHYDDIKYDILLRTVDSGTIERLREAAASIPGFDLTPTQARPHV